MTNERQMRFTGVADRARPMVEDENTRLLQLAELAAELQTDEVSKSARELSQRILEGRFYVACVGQFKRGKSTLLEALVGETILPTGFVPVTAVPTVLRYGSERRARARSEKGDWIEIEISEIEKYVSEEFNPENSKRIDGVEIFLPSPLLAGGMCFVDTPGLGSVFSGNTAATHAFIPHIDAALVVLGADPPLAGEELALIESVSKNVRDFLIVLNKADRTTEEERAAAAGFARKVLEHKLGRNVGFIYQVSAAEQLSRKGPERDWNKLIAGLLRLERESGSALLRAAGQRGIQRFTEELVAIITEERDALLRPIHESESRISIMRGTIAESGRSMRELTYLLIAEQQRLSEIFLDHRRAFLAESLPAAETELKNELQAVHKGYGPSYRRAAMHRAQAVARQHVLPWLGREQQKAEEAYREVEQRFVELGNSFLRRLADAGMPELARRTHALEAANGFRARSEFTFREMIELAEPASPFRWIADVALGVVRAHSRIDQDAFQFQHWLMEANSARVQNDLSNRVQESRGRLEVEIRKLLHEVSRIAERALENARSTLAQGSEATTAALSRLSAIEVEILGL